ncbi:ABC transporter substrate-binding protein [Terracidiphilus gabretensis]|uniref:ABC transporter substrate-binding protein n=1 Tax=Terracidiphilus gabretensis TaxID=1577687 RepID=UPI0009EB084F|nr:ABC transporter substrate-binding protein [Terracidiphilus gabretensis]
MRSGMRVRVWTTLCAVLLTAGVVVPGSGCRGGATTTANGLTPVRLQLDWYPQPEHGGFFEAQLNGYYKAEGLEVTLVPLPQYGSSGQLVMNGKAEFGLGTSDQVLEWNSNGLPLRAVAATMQHDAQAIMVHKDSPIHDFKDLEGHTIAAQTGATWLKYVTARYGLKNVKQISSTRSVANFLADPNYVQQIFITSEPFFVKQAGAEARTILISSSGYDPYRVQFTTREYAEQHADVVQKFVRATIRGWQDYLKDPSQVNKYLLTLNPALNPAQEAYTAQALRDGGFIGDDAQVGQMTAARWQASYDQLKALGILRNAFDPAQAYSLKFAGQ